jgi:hypothetical protein
MESIFPIFWPGLGDGGGVKGTAGQTAWDCWWSVGWRTSVAEDWKSRGRKGNRAAMGDKLEKRREGGALCAALQEACGFSYLRLAMACPSSRFFFGSKLESILGQSEFL